tara:strand:- start:431 stop:559 length:129 start_codon:yes stop_codon:yes gene_type:complete
MELEILQLLQQLFQLRLEAVVQVKRLLPQVEQQKEVLRYFQQ